MNFPSRIGSPRSTRCRQKRFTVHMTIQSNLNEIMNNAQDNDGDVNDGNNGNRIVK